MDESITDSEREAHNFIIPRHHRRMRDVALLCGVVVFLWSVPEDTQVYPVVLLSAASTLVLTVLWVCNRFGGQVLPAHRLPLAGAVMGAVVGVGTSVVTVLLMGFKNARHAHVYPDYPIGVMGAILERAPVWGVAGALVGIGLALLWQLTRDATPRSSP